MIKPKIFKVTGTPKALDNILFVQPDVAATYYSAVINVSDSPCASFDYQMKLPSFWFPIHEIEHWGYQPFLAALRVVDHYFTGEKPILMHCHAGANRSPSVAYAILIAKGYTEKEAEDSLGYPNFRYSFQRNIELNHIPKNLVDVLKFADKYKNYSLNSLLCHFDKDYVDKADIKYGAIRDYTLFIANEEIKLTYDKTKHKFVIKE